MENGEWKMEKLSILPFPFSIPPFPWAGTFRFRDPLKKERRFIPLRLADAPIKGGVRHGAAASPAALDFGETAVPNYRFFELTRAAFSPGRL
jgi:hypothetical protein